MDMSAVLESAQRYLQQLAVIQGEHAIHVLLTLLDTLQEAAAEVKVELRGETYLKSGVNGVANRIRS